MEGKTRPTSIYKSKSNQRNNSIVTNSKENSKCDIVMKSRTFVENATMKPPSNTRENSQISATSNKTCEAQFHNFVLVFNKITGSEKVNYFMVDPKHPDQILPKANTLVMKRLHYLTGHKVITLNNKIYIIGGRDWNSDVITNKVMSYDPQTNKWADLSPLTLARSRCNADVVDGNTIIVTGGEISRKRITDSVEKYDVTADQWTTLTSMPLPRVDHASVVLNGTLYVSGGITKLTNQCSPIFWAYSIEGDTWYEPIVGMTLPKECEKHTMVVTEGHKILLIGGRSFDEDLFRERDEIRVMCYDTTVKTNTRRNPCWCKVYPNMRNARSTAGSVVIGDHVYMIGGHNFSKDQDVLTVEAYDMTRQRWTEVFTLPNDGSYGNVDCCIIKVPRTNSEFNTIDSYLYDNWIMW